MATEKMIDLHGEIAVITGDNGGVGRRIPGSAEVYRVRVYGSGCDLTGAVRVAWKV